MFRNNLIMQISAIVGLILTIAFLIATCIPALGFESEVPKHEGIVIRIIIMIIAIGLLRGAF